MTHSEQVLFSLSGVRAQLDRVRALAAYPTAESLACCAPYLEEAIQGMEKLKERLAAAGPLDEASKQAASAELILLRGDLLRERTLLLYAASFYQGWAQAVSPVGQGYTDRGETPEWTQLGARFTVRL